VNKKLLCTAIGGALACSAGSASAYIDSEYEVALVPYVVKDTNRTTVVTVIVEADSSADSSGEVIHLQYWTKSTTDANTAACAPSSITVPVTNADIVTFDTAGILGYPLFGDTTNPAPLGMSISYAAPRHGYLIVQSGGDYGIGRLYLESAYWMELDLANGGAIGDQAPAFWSGSDYANADVNVEGEAWRLWANDSVNNPRAVNFWPSSVASTAFTVTPLGTAMLTKENNQVVMQVFNNNKVQGAYDRNENGVDGTVPVTVRCVGRVTPAQLMPGVVANVNWAAQGGWGYLANLGDNGTAGGTSDLDAIVYQVDSSSAGGKFMSNATRITSNDGGRP